MATVDDIPLAPLAEAPRHPGEETHQAPLFRFGLRQMFLFVSGIAALGGCMALVRGGWAVGIGFGAAMVAAHVLATSIGTRLRDRSSAATSRTSRQTGNALRGLTRRLTEEELAALTDSPLARHERAPFRTLLSAAGGAIGGGFGGAALIPILAGSNTTGAEFALGAASCAVMGGWLGLMAAHSWWVMRRTWRDANGGEAERARPRPKRMFRRV
jgi:hypothetical protein